MDVREEERARQREKPSQTINMQTITLSQPASHNLAPLASLHLIGYMCPRSALSASWFDDPLLISFYLSCIIFLLLVPFINLMAFPPCLPHLLFLYVN